MADEQVPSDLFVDGSHPSDLFKDGKPASDAPSFMQSHPIIRQGLQRLLTGFSTEDKANAPIDPLTGKQRLAPVDVASQSVLPELQHPADESWPGYLARGAYNQLIRPLGSAAGLLGAASIGEGGNISKSAPIVGKMQPIENAAAAPIAQEIPKPDVPTQPDLPLQDTTQLSPQDKLKAALSAAKPLRASQEELYTAERAQRLAKLKAVTGEGEEAEKARTAALSGEYPKVEFEALKLEQPEVDSLFKQIRDAPDLTDFDKEHAKSGLWKLLGDYGGRVPQNNELYALGRVFGSDFVQAARNKMGSLTKTGNLVSDVVNVPRSLMASTDMSAPLRQGLGLIHTKEFWQSMGDMHAAFGSENAFNATMDAIRAKPTYNLAQESGLSLTDLEGLLGKEEAFISHYTQKIPGVKSSERAYVAFLDKLRMDTFDRLVNDATAIGKDPSTNRVLAKQIATFVNTATGRGSLGKLEGNALMLNNFLFSPRLIASRIQMLNPYTYLNPKTDPFVRKEAIKSLLAVAGAGATFSSLAKMAGAEVESNPTSADFGKAKIGNTRLDPYGGFQQYIELFNKLALGESTSTRTGITRQLGQGYRPETRLSTIGRFARSKTNPAVGFVVDWLDGKDINGQPFNLPTAVASRVFPMMLQDLYDVAQQDPKLLPITVPASWYGMGVQSYQ